MQVQVNTGNGVESKETLERWATDFLHDTLSRFTQDLTRVEVQLFDENRGKAGAADKSCTLEARLMGHQPVVVHHNADNLDAAMRGAAHKLVHALDHTLGKLDRKHRDRDTIRRDPNAIT